MAIRKGNPRTSATGKAPPRAKAAARSVPALPLPRLAKPAQRALEAAGLHDLRGIARVSEADLAALHGMGPNAITTLRTALQAHGLDFSTRGAAPPSRNRRPR